MTNNLLECYTIESNKSQQSGKQVSYSLLTLLFKIADNRGLVSISGRRTEIFICGSEDDDNQQIKIKADKDNLTIVFNESAGRNPINSSHEDYLVISAIDPDANSKL